MLTSKLLLNRSQVKNELLSLYQGDGFEDSADDGGESSSDDGKDDTRLEIGTNLSEDEPNDIIKSVHKILDVSVWDLGTARKVIEIHRSNARQ